MSLFLDEIPFGPLRKFWGISILSERPLRVALHEVSTNCFRYALLHNVWVKQQKEMVKMPLYLVAKSKKTEL